jgi:hypothetical protein
MNRSMISRKTSWMPIDTGLASSRPRVILPDTTVMARTTSSSRIASRVTVVVFSSVGISPVISANGPWAADLAQPPQMKKNRPTRENGIHSQAPGGTLPKPTIGTSPVAST